MEDGMVDLNRRPHLDLQSINRISEPDHMVDSGYSDEMPSLTSTDSQTSSNDESPQSIYPPPVNEETTRLDNSPEMESIKTTARVLADDIVRYTSDANPPPPSSSHVKTLRRTVAEVTTKHQIPFNSIVKRLNAVDQSPENYRESFVKVADEMLSDGQINWGRIVTLYAFSGSMAKHCVEKSASTSTTKEQQKCIATATGNYVADKLAVWIKEQGGWDEMDRFFAEPEKPESCLWRGLLCTFVGLGALATIVSVK